MVATLVLCASFLATGEIGASIEGLITDAVTGKPVRKADVILRSEDGRASYGMQTAQDGRFRFAALEPGTYTFSVLRDGYVQIGEPPRPARSRQKLSYAVDKDQKLEGVELKLTPAGAITGRVVDADGDPLASATVTLAPVPAGRKARVFGSASTNDLGEYRVYNVPPGKYSVAAQFTSRLLNRDVNVVRTSEQDYVKTYHPGVIDSSQAAVVKVDPGATTAGIDITVRKAHTVRVAGRISGGGGGLLGSFVMVGLAPARPEDGGRMLHANTKPDGSFSIAGVLPGAYVLAAATFDPKRPFTARRAIDVGENDVEGIELALRPGQDVRGRVRVEGRDKPPSGLIVMPVPREFDRNVHIGTGNDAGLGEVRADGAFVWEHMPAMQYDILLASTSKDNEALYVKSISLGGTDVLADGLDLTAGEISDPIEIVLAEGGAKLECAVTDADGKPVAGAQVFLVPNPMRLALMEQGKTDEHGTAQINGIAPGEYTAIAFASAPDFTPRDPEALKPYRDQGRTVRLEKGGQARVEVRAIDPEQ